MANTLQVDIVTPYRSLFSGRVNMVTLSGFSGQMGILPRHAALDAGYRRDHSAHWQR